MKAKQISFDDLLATFPTENYGKGSEFEKLVKWWLKTDPYWSTELISNSVLLWSESPYRSGRDIGIDLTAEDFLGNVWAIQAKNWKEDNSLPKSEIDKFLSASNTAKFHKRLLITTTSKISINAALAMEQQEKEVKTVTISELRDSNIDWIQYLKKSKKIATKPPKKLFAHQEVAVQETVKGIKKYKVGQLIMACGTGKTLTAQRIDEKLNSKTTLILVPSLLLVQQTLKSWKNEAGNKFTSLAVCSDESVNRDLSIGSTKDLFFSTTTDSKVIYKFLNLKGKKVIVSTYQSSARIAQALKGKNFEFDLVIADEAHRLSGTVDEEYGTVLKRNLIPSKYLLFMTATPKIFTTRVQKIAATRGVEVLSMDDESIFGPVLHSYSFSKAISDEVLTDYRVVVMGVGDSLVRELIDERELVRVGNVSNDAATLASHVGLAKSMHEFNLNKVISFHSRVSSAKRFSEDHYKLKQWIKDNKLNRKFFESYTLSGKDSTEYRKKILDKLKEGDESTQKLLTNARCLTEGVDVPTLDGIAFIDPRASQIDIVQAVGRAIRKGGDKKEFGYILIPIFLSENDVNQEIIDGSVYKPIWDVINALKSHDSALAEEIDNLRINLGARKNSRDIGSKITLDIPRDVTQDFVNKIFVQIVEKTSSDWYESYGELKDFVGIYGYIPSNKEIDKEKYLSSWIIHQRQLFKSKKLDARKIKLLEELPGWSWNPFDDAWQFGLERLKAYVEIYGNAKVPITYTDKDGFPLGRWVSKRRDNEKKLSKQRRLELERVTGWTWDPHNTAWDNGFNALKVFNEKYGHTRVPKTEKYEKQKYSLSGWVIKQRADRDSLSPQQVKKLESLKGWSWNPYKESWNQGFSELEKYFSENGDARVPSNYITDSGFNLGNWVVFARSKEKSLEEEWKKRLEGMPGWTWNSKVTDWQYAYEALVEYSIKNRCLPPRDFRTNSGIPLGRWVRNQREKYNAGTATLEEIALLEKVEFWSWKVQEDEWNKTFLQLKKFVSERGRFPKDKEKDDRGKRIGSWVYLQKKNRFKLSKDQQKKLESLHNWRW